MVAGCRRKRLLWLLFVAYCLMLLWLLFFGRIGDGQATGQINLRPLQTVKRYLWVLRHSTEPGMRSNAVANLLGNVALFVPLGLFLPWQSSYLRCFWRFLLIVGLVILDVELAQAATGLGTFDVDDLLLNLLGAALGYVVCRLVQKYHHRGGASCPESNLNI